MIQCFQMSAKSELNTEPHYLSESERRRSIPVLYDKVKDMLFANPTFLRKSAEAVWDEKPPRGWRQFTIPTNTTDVYEVYKYTNTRRVAVDHVGFDGDGKRYVRDSIEVLLEAENSDALPNFSSCSGKNNTVEALVGFNAFVREFKATANYSSAPLLP